MYDSFGEYISDVKFAINFPTDVLSCAIASNEDRSANADFFSISSLNKNGFYGYNTYFDSSIVNFPTHADYHYGKYIAIGY